MSIDPLALIDDPEDAARPPATWQVLVVDDEPQVHDVTRLALMGFECKGRGLELSSAYSAADAIQHLSQHGDIALVLLDVVMESDDAGFDVVRHVRETMQNRNIRIILRTGQPGQAPPKAAVQQYDINDYQNKADLTAEKMFTSIYTALSMFDHLQSLARREQQLAAAYRDIEQLVYIASHDLQEPLRSVSSLCKRLERSGYDQLDDTGQRCIDYVFDAVNHMKELVTDLLDYSRIGQPQPMETFMIEPMIDELRNDLAFAVQDSNATIEYEGESRIRAQRLKIKLLLQNLISNSIKFARPGVPPRITIDVQGVDDDVTIFVSDNGIGIAPEHQDKIFRVFQRLQDKGETPGTGIGLAHCKRIVELHDGHIGVTSTPGEGTTISCSLKGARV